MAVGFKVADAYVLVRTEDNTKAGRDKVERDTDRWARQTGDKAGKGLMAGVARGLLTGVRTVMMSLLQFTVISSIVGLIGAAITALSGYIVQLMGAITPLAQALWASLGVLALLPGAIFTVVGAVAALKIGFSGMGAALKAGFSGDLAAFEEQLTKLAPAAQEFARALVAVKPAWDELRLSVQQALFQDLAPLFEELTGVYIPLLERGLGRVAEGLNSIMSAVMRSLLDPYTSRNVEATLMSVGRILDNLAVGLEPLLTALSQVVSVSTGILADMSEGWGQVLTEWAEVIRSIPEDQWAEWVDSGIKALKLLGNVIGDIAGIVRGIFVAAGPSDPFGWLDRVNRWVNSLAGQTALSQFFMALRTAAEALSPALFELARVLSVLMMTLSETMVAIGPTLESLVTTLGRVLDPLLGGPMAQALIALGDILIGLLEGIGPGLVVLLQALADALTTLAPVAQPVGRALGEILKALAPLVQLLAGSVLATTLLTLAQMLELLALFLAPTIELLAAFGDALLKPLLDITLHGPGFRTLNDALRRFGDLIRPLIPHLAHLGGQVMSRILDVLIKLQPLFTEVFLHLMQTIVNRIPQWVDRFGPLAETIVLVVELLGNAMLDALEQIGPKLPDLITAFVDFSLAMGDLLMQLIPLVPSFAELAVIFARDMIPFIIPMIPLFVELARTFLNILILLTEEDPRTGYSLLSAFVFFVTVLMKLNLQLGPARIGITLFQGALVLLIGVVKMINDWIASFVDFLRRLREAMQTAADWIARGGASIGNTFRGIASVILGSMSGLPNSLWGIGVGLINGLVNGIQAALPRLISLLQWVTYMIPNWKGPLDVDKRLLVPSGQATIGGYIEGLQSRIPTLRSVLAQLTEAIPGMAGGSPALAAAGVGAVSLGGIVVYIGERPVRDMVRAEIVDNPETVAGAAREGDRRATYVDPSRRFGR